MNLEKWGNGTAVRIPAAVLEVAGIRVDDTVDVRAEGGKVVIERVGEPNSTLDGLLARITPDTLREPIDFGDPVGTEAL